MPEITIDKNYKNTISTSIDSFDEKYAKLIDVDTNHYDSYIYLTNYHCESYQQSIRESEHTISDLEQLLSMTKWYHFKIRRTIKLKIQIQKDKIIDYNKQIDKEHIENLKWRICRLEQKIDSITKKKDK